MIDPGAPAITADDLGLTRGDGCFETTRVVTSAGGDHRIDHLDAHFDRLDRSCAGLELPPIDRAGWRSLIEDALSGWDQPGEALLRLMVSRGRESDPDGPITGLLTLTPIAPETLRQRRQGIDVITLDRGVSSTAFADARWLLGGIKTLSYAVNMAAMREARRRGAHDVMFLSSDGYVLEGPTAAVVWLAGGVLHTTPADGTGVLASITQAALFAAAERTGVPTRQALATPAELLECEGVWLASSGRGIAQVLKLDGAALDSKPGLTAQLTELAGF